MVPQPNWNAETVVGCGNTFKTCLLKMLKYIFNEYQTTNITPSCKVFSSSFGLADSPALLSGTAVALSLTWHEVLFAAENEKWVPILEPPNPKAGFSRKVVLFWSLRSQWKDVDFRFRDREEWQWYLAAGLVLLLLKISCLSFEGLVEVETTESRSRWQLAISGNLDPRGVEAGGEVPIQELPSNTASVLEF